MPVIPAEAGIQSGTRIPRSHRFARSRPLTQAKGAFPSPPSEGEGGVIHAPSRKFRGGDAWMPYGVVKSTDAISVVQAASL